MGLDVGVATVATTVAVPDLMRGDKVVTVAATHCNSVGGRCCAW